MSDPRLSCAVVACITLSVTCECGADDVHQLELEQAPIDPGWSAAIEDRFILCEECGCVIDAGLVISVAAPEKEGKA